MKKTRGIGKGNLCIPLQSYDMMPEDRNTAFEWAKV